MITGLHHVAVVLPDADLALKFFRDLMGLTVTADQVVEEQGVRGVLLACGENEIELLQPTRADTGVSRFLDSRGPTLHHFCFSTDDIRGELALIEALGLEIIDKTPRVGLAGEVAFIHPRSMHGVLVELAQPPAGAHASTAKGFDHLAVRVSDLQAAAKRWNDVVGLPLVNTIGPSDTGTLIGQMPTGQCMVELIAPATPEAALAKQIAENGEGAASMVAIEVQDIAAEVARYRAAGITIPDATPGVLPNSVRTSISADQAFGLSIQLIQFKR